MKFVTITSKHIYVVILVLICVGAGIFYYFHRGGAQQTFTVEGSTGPDAANMESNIESSANPAQPPESAADNAAPASPAPSAGAPPSPSPSPSAPKTVTVYITGAVNKEGVYTMPDGKRVEDLIALAGGAAPNADLSRVNLAAYVQDAQHIVVPKKDETVKPDTNAGTSKSAGSAGGGSSSSNKSSGSKAKTPPQTPVNINTATAEELETLPGIGPVAARNIILFRTKYGPFKTPAGIQAVSGIGQAEFFKIESYITVD